MRYLYGDSTESDLEFDYLAFLREVIDCAVVMAECEVTLAVTVEGRRARELETASVVAAVDELGRRASELVAPVATDQGATPVGRCAAAIAAAVREAVDRESSQARGALAIECDEMDRQDQRQRGRARTVLEKLLRTHDLPGADKTLEVAWSASGVKATMRQRTGFGVEAVISLDIPASSMLGLDLRVDKIAEGVEVHAHETAGWLKKSDKVVAQKLGRFQVASVVVGGDATTVRLRATPEASAAGFVITSRRDGELRVEPTGAGPGREVAIEDRHRPALRLLVERLETAVRALAENRTGLASIEIDGASIAQYDHPRVLAERLVAAVAPTVQQIAQRSRSPGELVLRRLLGDNRREEIFISTADLLKRLDGLPSHAREVFAPLQLGGEPAKPPVDEPRLPARSAVDARPAPAMDARPAHAPAMDARPAPVVPAATAAVDRSVMGPVIGPVMAPVMAIDRRFDTESDARPEPRPDARSPAPRTMPPPPPMPEGRSGLNRLAPPGPSTETRRAARPAPHRDEPAMADSPIFEDRSPPFSTLRSDPTPPTAAKPYPAPEARAVTSVARAADKPHGDSMLGDAIERALDEADSPPPPK